MYFENNIRTSEGVQNSHSKSIEKFSKKDRAKSKIFCKPRPLAHFSPTHRHTTNNQPPSQPPAPTLHHQRKEPLTRQSVFKAPWLITTSIGYVATTLIANDWFLTRLVFSFHRRQSSGVAGGTFQFANLRIRIKSCQQSVPLSRVNVLLRLQTTPNCQKLYKPLQK